MASAKSRARDLGYGSGILLLLLAAVSVMVVAGRDRLTASDAQAAASLSKASRALLAPTAPIGDPSVAGPSRTDPNTRLAVVSDDGVQEEPGDANPAEPTSDAQDLGFHRHPPFASAWECSQDRYFNPRQIELNAADQARLEGVIDHWNRRLEELETQKGDLARSLAQDTVDQGRATELANGIEIPTVSGSISVTFTYPGGRPPQLVVIRPGDFVELDLIALDIENTVQAGTSEIQEFFATL
jgi:hypothetical protein